MKKLTYQIWAFLSLTMMIGLGTANAQTFVAKLTGAQEALPVASRASGMIIAELSGNQLEVSGSFDDLESNFDATIAGGAHLHLALIGQNGPIAHQLTTNLDLDQRGGSWNSTLNTFTLTTAEITALQRHGMYLNIHTTGEAGGELRGQLVPAGSKVYTSNLFGSNEVPSIISDAQGAMLYVLKNDTLTVSGSFQGLESDFDATVAGGAHIHNGMAGENGGVELLLDATVDAGLRSGAFQPANNTFAVSATQIQLLEMRSMYTNIHTTGEPGGELRGNVVGNPNSVWRAHLAGYNEVPVVTSTGHGELLLELSNDTLWVHGAFADLSSAFDPNVAGGAHIHLGMAGQTGAPALILDATLASGNLAGSFAAANNEFVLSSGQIDTIFNRGMYVNLHSTGNAAGEIRGQIVQEGNYFFNGFMSGNFEVPAILTKGEGFVTAEVLGDRLIVTGSFSNLMDEIDLSIAGGAHLHGAYAGSNGDVLQLITATPDASNLEGVFASANNEITLDSTTKAMLRERMVYTNIHSLAYASGELRSQLLHEATAYFMGTLSGGQQPTPVNTMATGGIAAEWVDGNICITGSFNDLESDFNVDLANGSHIHSGLAGMSGDVAIILNASLDGSNRNGTYPIEDNKFDISSGMADSIAQRWAYVNIHSMNEAAGEIRAQLMPLANSYLYTNINGWHAIDPVQSTGNGGLMVERVQSNIALSGSFEGLMAAVDTSIVGGIHLHTGGPGTSGDVAVVVNTDFETDLMSGMFWASENWFEIDEATCDSLIAQGVYINIHSTAHGSGEIRGQLLPDHNNAPEWSEVLTPAAGLVVDIDTAVTSIFTVTWDVSSDTNNNDIAYIWQLSMDSTFDSVMVSSNVNADLMFTTDHNTVNGWLAANGVWEGDTATLYHRVVVTDGSMDMPGESKQVMMHRSVITGIEQPTKSSYVAYPNPATNVLQVQWDDEAQPANLQIVDLSGRVLKAVQLPATNTGISAMQVGELPTGMYLIQFSNEAGQLTHQSKLMIQR